MFAQSICTADMPSPNTYLATYVAKFTPRSQLIDFTWSKNTRYTSSYCKALAKMCTCSHLKTQKCSIVFNSRWFTGAGAKQRPNAMLIWLCQLFTPLPSRKIVFSETISNSCLCYAWFAGVFLGDSVIPPAKTLMSFMVSQRTSVPGPGGKFSNVTSWVCKLCGYASKYRHVCTEHMYYKHGQEEHLPCEYCGVVFTKRPSLRKHKLKCAKNQLYPID